MNENHQKEALYLSLFSHSMCRLKFLESLKALLTDRHQYLKVLNSIYNLALFSGVCRKMLSW